LFCWSCPVRILIQNKIISIQTIKDILNSINLEDFDINEYNKIIKERTNRKYRYNNLFLEDDESE
jgi:type IV secretory pathway ATPase VirB11/archaellum biosynthesis ATPase